MNKKIKGDRKNLKEFTFIDLFAGIGGIRLGFEAVGGRCVFSSEWDKFAVQTYKANFFDKEVHGDITKISEKDIPPFDILCAGFPCQPFSQAGLKKGLLDTRGTLFFDIARIVEYHRPKVVFLENVKRFKTHDAGNTFLVVKNVLQELGYSVYDKVLNAKDFALPQNRERIFIVAFLGKTEFNFPLPYNTKTRLGDILERDVLDKYTLSDALWAGHQARKEKNLKKGYGFGYSMFNEDSVYTSTISARYYKDGSEILIEQKGKNPRKLTPREAARLQGFPDTFKIPVSDNQAYKQFGNSVAVNVIKALAKEIVLGMEKLELRKKENLKSINLESIKNEAIKKAC
ncbi:MAG: DNA cytosine methyltransferase [Bdellovibrionota bacterium]